MRILLAAVNAPKGDLDGNLARHLAALDQARAQGCHLAVFPECSLTGSVDPRRRPERAVAVDTPRTDIAWLGPYPDDGYERREAVELAFVAACQHLPGNVR